MIVPSCLRCLDTGMRGNGVVCICTAGESDLDKEHSAVLVAYLLSAVQRKDWHAVSDAANDLRVLEASRR